MVALVQHTFVTDSAVQWPEHVCVQGRHGIVRALIRRNRSTLVIECVHVHVEYLE
jgi:hypothetical protein